MDSQWVMSSPEKDAVSRERRKAVSLPKKLRLSRKLKWQHPMEPEFHHFYHHQKQMNSGLSRYQSAPSAYFASFLDKDFYDDLLMNRPTSPETEKIFARFLQSSGSNTSSSLSGQKLPKQSTDLADIKLEQETDVVVAAIDSETGAANQKRRSNYAPAVPQTMYQSQSHQGLSSNRKPGSGPTQTRGLGSGGGLPPARPSGEGTSSLVRHSSSPADLFSTINIENVYVAAMKSMGEIGGGGNNRETSFTSSSAGLMNSVPETPNRPSSYQSGLPPRSGEDPTSMPTRTLSGLKRLSPGDRSLSGGMNRPETKNVDALNRRPPLAHHLSLPKSLSDVEKFLEESDSVPCKIRAKRGCATHPRSIAERVRRTKISERMRKLQDIVPNMDKQTNTAEMLDLAVEYIKDLQNQVKTLLADRAMCTCSNTV